MHYMDPEIEGMKWRCPHDIEELEKEEKLTVSNVTKSITCLLNTRRKTSRKGISKSLDKKSKEKKDHNNKMTKERNGNENEQCNGNGQ